MGMTGAVGFGQRQVLATLAMHLQQAHIPSQLSWLAMTSARGNMNAADVRYAAG